MPISKTSLTPSLVFEAHPIYPKAPILFTVFLPSSSFPGSCLSWLAPTFCAHPSKDPSSPKQDNGTEMTTGVHFSGIFSDECLMFPDKCPFIRALSGETHQYNISIQVGEGPQVISSCPPVFHKANSTSSPSTSISAT